MSNQKQPRKATSEQMFQSVQIIHQQSLNFEQHNMLHKGFLAATVQAARQGKLDEKKLLAFRQFLGIRARVIDLGNGVTMTEPVILTVDYGRLWEVMKTAAGFDASNSNNDITPERFPITGSGIVRVEASLFNFVKGTSSDNAEAVIANTDKAHPWSVGKIEHTLAYGIAFPDEQLEYPIVGLGSVAEWDGYAHVVCLGMYGLRRILYLHVRGDDWYVFYRFLAFRILPSVS